MWLRSLNGRTGYSGTVVFADFRLDASYNLSFGGKEKKRLYEKLGERSEESGGDFNEENG